MQLFFVYDFGLEGITTWPRERVCDMAVVAGFTSVWKRLEALLILVNNFQKLPNFTIKKSTQRFESFEINTRGGFMIKAS